MSDELIPLVLALNDAAATLELVGGKGASLAHMAAAGLPIPPGFYITTAAYHRFVMENGLQEEILAAASPLSANTADHPVSLEEASKKIGKLFAKSKIPDDIAGTIRQAYAELGEGDIPVAVRSSATAEDLPEMSFAGQQETYLNMHGATMVLDAVKRCWASLWTARAIGYRKHHNIAPQDVSLAVVVQKLVPADAAGILFTANPLTGARNQVMINAAWGLGEAIVSGQVTPDTVVVDKTSGAITEQEISEKDVMTVRISKGTREEAVPADQRNRAVLSPSQATELARIGTQIENLYGRPMDIEWTLHNGCIWIVQARPITALPDFPKPSASQATQTIEWKLPHPNGHYMRSSVLELLPDPLTPLFATLGLPIWSRVTLEVLQDAGLGRVFADEYLVTINGYGYYNLTFTPTQVARMLLALPHIAVIFPSLLGTSQARWQLARSRYAAVTEYWQAKDLATTAALNLLGGVYAITTEAAEHYLSIQGGILPAAYISEALFTLVYNKFLKKRNAPSALTFMLGYDSAPIQAEKSLYDLAQWARAQDELSTTLQNMSSTQFTLAYQTRHIDNINEALWSEFRQRLTTHLAHFGHTIYDLDFSKPVPADDPAALLETLKFFLGNEAPDPRVRQASSTQAREKATKALLAGLRGPFRLLFRRQLQRAQHFVPLRENALADVGLGWPILRQMLREIGQRLVSSNSIDTPDDVFWLTRDELQEAATALDADHISVNYRTILAERHASWERERTLTPPVALPLKEGARFLGIDFSSVMPARTDQPEGNMLKGIAGSPGHVTGIARIIHGPHEFEQMRQGDILVARITTPAWTPLFALAAGVVTDVGGPLSHSSIVAREYHIPAVLGTGVATERLSSGQRITVDGDAGTVAASS